MSVIKYLLVIPLLLLTHPILTLCAVMAFSAWTQGGVNQLVEMLVIQAVVLMFLMMFMRPVVRGYLNVRRSISSSMWSVIAHLDMARSVKKQASATASTGVRPSNPAAAPTFGGEQA